MIEEDACRISPELMARNFVSEAWGDQGPARWMGRKTEMGWDQLHLWGATVAAPVVREVPVPVLLVHQRRMWVSYLRGRAGKRLIEPCESLSDVRGGWCHIGPSLERCLVGS